MNLNQGALYVPLLIVKLIPTDNFFPFYFYSFIGRKEGTVNRSSAYYVLTLSEDKSFEAYPIESW